MKICTKCKIDKEDKEFQTYWHSTQKKFRIRKECTLCHNTQHNERRRLKRLESKLIQVSQPDLSTDKNYQQCRTCEEYKLKTEYYRYNNLGKKSYLDCRICINKKEVERSRIDRLKELKENGGSYQHKVNPGEWIDDYQKEATYNILKAIGWKLNEENGIWWKDGIKTSKGVFINIKSKKQISFDKALELRNNGKTYKQIGKELSLSETTIIKWLSNEKY